MLHFMVLGRRTPNAPGLKAGKDYASPPLFDPLNKAIGDGVPKDWFGVRIERHIEQKTILGGSPWHNLGKTNSFLTKARFTRNHPAPIPWTKQIIFARCHFSKFPAEAGHAHLPGPRKAKWPTSTAIQASRSHVSQQFPCGCGSKFKS